MTSNYSVEFFIAVMTISYADAEKERRGSISWIGKHPTHKEVVYAFHLKKSGTKPPHEVNQMPRGDKGAYTGKQKRQAEKIEEGYKKRGVSTKEAQRRAWATVNKESGGGKKSGSGRKKKMKKSKS